MNQPPLYHQRQLLLAALLMLSGVAAWACFTPDRAAILALEHPDADFVNAAVHAHHPNPIPYFGPQQATPCVNGFADVFPCRNVTLLSHIELPEIGSGSGSDSWGWTDAQTGIEYAIIGRSNGVAFVSLADPVNPVYLGNLPRPAGVNTSVWADIKVYQDHAFMVADSVNNYGMQVLDLSVLRDVSNPPVTFSATAVYNEFDSAHNIVINTDTGFAYAVGGNSCSGGLHMVDIKTPAQPVFAGCFSSDGYTHDAHCVVYDGPDLEHVGKEICLNSNEDTLTIVDVSDKDNLVQISRTAYPNFGYTHQGWLTEDHSHFLIDDELDESGQNLTGTRTITMDVSDLDNPTLAGEHFAAGAAIDHNQYIRGNHTYQANYRRGLRILRISDPSTGELVEEAYFDTYPEADGNSFSGAWNVYPFFSSGNVLISDFNRGFFLVRPELEIVHIDGFESGLR
ncbi:MAG: choice-of-anchor B family protein [Gammaproteobacteria bacterium]|nr:choice-of-anchor B family protein [Gammaproteobacteria bacterium]